MLQEYNLLIKRNKGKDNAIADAWSKIGWDCYESI